MGKFFNPVESYCGVNKLESLSSIIESLNLKSGKILLLNRGGTFHGSQEEKIILEQLKKKELFSYDVSISNPDVKDLYELVKETNKNEYDLVLAIGGGSVLDVAKSICALKGMTIESVEALRTIIVNKSYLVNTNISKWIAVPTTAGTGSEMTCWATIWDNEKGLKHSVESKEIYAVAAIIDPILTINLPMDITVSSALDAICHATEAYWSKNTNEITRIFSVRAIENIIQNIEMLIADPKNIEYRSKIAMGSFFAGLAFSNTRTTACHSISYPITLMFGINHGIAVSMTLAKVLKLNEGSLIEKERLFQAFGINNSEEIDVVIKNIYKKANISPNLKDYGVKKAEIISIVDNAYVKGRMDNNPVDITKEMIEEILHAVY